MSRPTIGRIGLRGCKRGRGSSLPATRKIKPQGTLPLDDFVLVTLPALLRVTAHDKRTSATYRKDLLRGICEIVHDQHGVTRMESVCFRAVIMRLCAATDRYFSGKKPIHENTQIYLDDVLSYLRAGYAVASGHRDRELESIESVKGALEAAVLAAPDVVMSSIRQVDLAERRMPEGIYR